MTKEQEIKNEPVKSVNEATRKSEKLYFSHDGMFRFFFEKKNLVESFLKKYVPAEIINDLDFNTLTITKDTFIDKKLSRCYSDILYHILFKNNPTYVYLLFEHKSTESDFPGLQLLKYMVNIWETHINQHKDTKKLPPIIPLLIYHGGEEWKAKTNFISLFNIPRCLEKYIPAFNFELYDISHMPDEEIKGNVELRIILTAFKYIFSPELIHKLKDIFQLLLELEDKTKGTEYLEILLRYFSNNAENVKEEQIQESVTNFLEQGGVIMSTLAQQWKEIGLQEGKQIGQEEGEEKNKVRVALNCLRKGYGYRCDRRNYRVTG